MASTITASGGLSFADLSVGAEMTSRMSTEVTAPGIFIFAHLSGDHSQVHLNEEHAKHTRFHTRIAHGAYGLSIATGLATDLGLTKEDVFFEEFREWRFLRPIKIGDVLHLKVVVQALDPGNERKPKTQPPKAEFEVTLLNQDDRAVQKGIWVARFETPFES